MQLSAAPGDRRPKTAASASSSAGLDLREEVGLDAGEMCGLGRLEQLGARGGQPGMAGPFVLGAAAPLHQPAGLEGVDDARHAAEAEASPFGEVREPENLALRGGEPGKQLDGAEAQPVLRLELGVHRPGEALVGLEETDPHLGLSGRELRRWRGSSHDC